MLELVLVLGLASFVALVTASILDHLNANKKTLAARAEALAQNEILLQRVIKLFRTRMATRDDKGFAIAACSSPGSTASCLDVYRHRSAGEGVERYRIKNVCQALPSKQLAFLQSAGVDLAALARSMQPLCGFSCSVGSRPVIVQRHWPDFKGSGGSSRDEIWPRGRIGAQTALAAGFCAKHRTASEVYFVQAMAFLKDEPRDPIKLVKKDVIVPVDDDASKIDWLP